MGEYKKGPVKGHDTVAKATRCAVLHLDIRQRNDADDVLGQRVQKRDPQVRLDEAVALTEAINLEVAAQAVVPIRKVRPATIMGEGAIEEWHDRCHADNIEVIVVDARLTPVQQRNLERGLEVKVLDRTALILEIFGARARTKEGRLQVDLAQLSYQRSRLVRSWTHLERQRGGAGFMGGPGESQLEIDRRLIAERIDKLKSDLAKVRLTRKLQREWRQSTPVPVVAIVGYTNAGKSTLFNRLTDADVMAKDMLFATLDPTLRKFKLPSGQDVVFADTVGFVSDLPHELVDAFRATLEEVQQADLILHVRNASHPDWDAQKEDVGTVLESLGVADSETAIEQIEVWNKCDLPLAQERVTVLQDDIERHDVHVTSAISGSGLQGLLAAVDSFLTRGHKTLVVDVPWAEGAALAWLHANGDVTDTQATDNGTRVHARVTPADYAKFESRFGDTAVVLAD